MFTKKKLLFIIVVLVVLIVLSVIFFTPVFTRIPVWYAVHLTNGQVYFGQIKSIASQTIILKETYYLETLQTQPSQSSQSKNFQVETSPQQIYSLVRRGSGNNLMPTNNVLFIDRSTVLFWEKLKPESGIVKAINKLENGI